MSLYETRREQMFPALSEAQMEVVKRLAGCDVQEHPPNALLYSIGDRQVPAYFVVSGTVDVHRHDGAGLKNVITHYGPGSFTGELSQLTGRRALADAHAGKEGCKVLALDAEHLRTLVIGSADIGELVMRAFILRRTALIAEHSAGPVLVGPAGSADLVALENLLARNGFPYTTLDSETDAEGKALVEKFFITDADLPIALCPDGELLKRPTEAELAACLEITAEFDSDKLFDVAIVGAGPAGLAAAVYGASEGLSMIVLDARSFGGQAGASARIENYLGFPTGISGHALAARAYTQALKFGAQIVIPSEVDVLDCKPSVQDGEPLKLTLKNGREILARSVVIASGARYRRLDVPNLDELEGAGVHYWASPIEARLCAGEEVALIGAGNSAGQAVVYLSGHVKRLHLVIRSDGLEASMSKYLIDRIKALPNVELHTQTEVTALEGDRERGLSSVTFRDRKSQELKTVAMRHLFLFIGADPNTAWLESCAAQLDNKGFVRTGVDIERKESNGRPHPMALETSIPRVFAVGDVRSGSTKRVAAAVGDGASVVAQIHALLAQNV